MFAMQSNINIMQQQTNMPTNVEHIEPEVELVSDDGKLEVNLLIFSHD